MRIGNGFDAHRFGARKPLMLGTVEIDERRLSGHSDGDVVAHALCDALLAAAGLPDIGVLFPGTEEWKGVSGARMLEVVRDRVRGAGFTIANAHVVVVCERPRLADHKGPMGAALTALLGAPVGVSATTTDGMDATGHNEGIACHAVALLERS
ncbi:MAG: 2-C-methyl-D-erythritol 2,4-cyclodiphosphate synthase [Thermoleophilia bacterium]